MKEGRIFEASSTGETKEIPLSQEELSKATDAAQEHAREMLIAKAKTYYKKSIPNLREEDYLKMFKDAEERIIKKHMLKAYREMDDSFNE